MFSEPAPPVTWLYLTHNPKIQAYGSKGTPGPYRPAQHRVFQEAFSLMLDRSS